MSPCPRGQLLRFFQACSWTKSRHRDARKKLSRTEKVSSNQNQNKSINKKPDDTARVGPPFAARLEGESNWMPTIRASGGLAAYLFSALWAFDKRHDCPRPLCDAPRLPNFLRDTPSSRQFLNIT